MIWVGWRQQRTETIIAAALLALLAAALVPTGLHIADAYDHGGLSGCAASDSAACRDAVDAFLGRFGHLGDLLDWVTIVPGVIGLLLAAPFISALEHGTHRLDWTQSVTRGRWLSGKLGLAVVSAAVGAAALIALVTWWRAPFVHLEGRMDNSIYDSEGAVPLGYALFGLGLAVAIGAAWRRTVPTLFVTFAGYFAARVLFDTTLRQHLVKPVATTWRTRGPGPDLAQAWVISQYPSDRAGHVIAPVMCQGSGPCGVKAGQFAFMHAIYEPASRFWPLQIRETLLFAVAGLVLVAFGAWWTRRRAA